MLSREIARVLPRVRRLRRELHAHPEIAYDEHQTRQRVIGLLRKTPLRFWRPLIGTDVIADLTVPGAAEVVCLRADMDALRLQEETGLPYASHQPGLMHACGHDGHTAMLVGAALVLSRLTPFLRANVRFVFQPAEEIECGGARLVALGACAGVDEAYAVHGWHDRPLGTVVSRRGPFFAASGFFTITVHGKGTHGAAPKEGRNPIPAAAALVERLDRLHQATQARHPAVVSVCSFNAGTNANIIPASAVVRGTTRFFDPRLGRSLERDVRSMVDEVTRRFGVRCSLKYESRYSRPVVNTDFGFAKLKEAAAAGGQKLLEAPDPLMTSEDFAFYLEGREGALALLGLGRPWPALHTPRFDFNDDALAPGIGLLCRFVLGKR